MNEQYTTGTRPGQRVALIGELGSRLTVGTLYVDYVGYGNADKSACLVVNGLLATLDGKPYQNRRIEAVE